MELKPLKFCTKIVVVLYSDSKKETIALIVFDGSFAYFAEVLLGCQRGTG